jgi:hypothetical protein
MTTKKHSNYQIPLLLFSLALLIAVVAIAINTVKSRTDQFSQVSNIQVTSTLTPTPNPEIAPYLVKLTPPPIAPQERWQVYSNQELGISLKHPPDWFFSEHSNPLGTEYFFSTPVKQSDPTNWALNQLAGGDISREKLSNNESLDFFIRTAQNPENPLATATRLSSWRVDDIEAVVLEIPEGPTVLHSVFVFVEKDGFAYSFHLSLAPQSIESNWKTYQQTFEQVLSTVTFLK